MASRLRIDLSGFHHIINRGVNKCIIFRSFDDKNMFLKILDKAALIHKITLHTFVLMNNHYHLLLETKSENLSSFMHILAANYARYYNKKYSRTGHLWQARFYSRFIINEKYLFTTMKYIEYNPLEARLIKKISSYEYTFSYYIFNNIKYLPCLNESILLKSFTIKELSDFLNTKLTKDEILFLGKKENEKIIQEKTKIHRNIFRKLEFYFKSIDSNFKRNRAIMFAYTSGYSQASISRFLNISSSLVSKIVKSGNYSPGAN